MNPNVVGIDGERARDLWQVVQEAKIDTPAFVFDESALLWSLGSAQEFARRAGCQLLYSLKACVAVDVLDIVAPGVTGFAASSPFEAERARELCEPGQSVHFTSPGIRESDIGSLSDSCDYLTFNTLEQWARFRPRLHDGVRCGLRVNPEISFVDDRRYDPCADVSKLGVPIGQLGALPENSVQPAGLHVHNNCDSSDLSEMVRTIDRLESSLGGLLSTVEWVNLGGGYLFEEAKSSAAAIEAIEKLRRSYDVSVFLEPGAGIVRSAGYLASTVVDLFDRGGRRIAILDTTVNHWPEVYEYQFEPDAVGDSPDGDYEYLLAGCSCLPGDLFGEYAFDMPLTVGSRVLFTNAGAYSIVKAHYFNGINMPSLYMKRVDGELVLQQQHTYDEFLSRTGAKAHVVV